MPSIADESGTKLFNLLEMFGRELLRNKMHESAQARKELAEARQTARDLSSAPWGLFSKESSQTYTVTWFSSKAGAQTVLRELKQLSPELFANATVVGNYLVHPKDKSIDPKKRVIANAIMDISHDHRLVSRALEAEILDNKQSEKGYIKSQPDGDCRRFSFGEFGGEGASFNAAYFCSVLQDYDINARHVGNQVIVNNADADKAIEAFDIEEKKIEAMGPERGELFMRQRYMDRLGVEFEPPMIDEGPDDHDDAGEGRDETRGEYDADGISQDTEVRSENEIDQPLEGNGDLGADAPMPDTPRAHEDDADREVDDGGFYVPSFDDVDESRGVEPAIDSPAGGKTGPESTEEIAEEELAEKTVESSPAARPDGELSADDADEVLSRETRKAELHEDISNSKTTADCVQARPDAHNGDLSTPYADGQDAPGTGDTDGDGIRDAAEDRDGDGVPDKLDSDAEYIDDDPDYEPVSMKERTVDELVSDKGEEAAFVASRSAAQAEKDVSLETVNR